MIKSEEKLVLAEVDNYESFADLEKYTNIDEQEFKDLLESNELQDLTRGYYDEDEDTFVTYPLDSDEIIITLLNELYTSGIENWLACHVDDYNYLPLADKLIAMLQNDEYTYLTLGGHLYALHK